MKNESTIRILRAALLSAGAAFVLNVSVKGQQSQSITAAFTTVVPTENVTYSVPNTVEPGTTPAVYNTTDSIFSPLTYNWSRTSEAANREVGASFTTTGALVLDKFTVQIFKGWRSEDVSSPEANNFDDNRHINGIGGQAVEISLLTLAPWGTDAVPTVQSTVSLGTVNLPTWNVGEVSNYSFLTFDLPDTILAANTTYGILLTFVTADGYRTLPLVCRTPSSQWPGYALYKIDGTWQNSNNGLVSYIQTTAIPPAVPEPATTAALLGAALGGAALGLRHFAARR